LFLSVIEAFTVVARRKCMHNRTLLKKIALSIGLFSTVNFFPNESYAKASTALSCQSDGKDKRPQQEEPIAVINGRKINKSEVDAPMASQIQALEQKIYEMRSRSLETLINKLLLEEEAARRGISLEELRRQVIAGVKVEDKEVEDAYNNNLSRYGPPPVSEIEAKERIRAALESQKRSEALSKAINELRGKSKIELNLKAPDPLKVEIDKNGPSLGAESAPITIAVFSDFQCQYCKKVNETLKQVVQSNGNNVRILYKNLPLPNHAQAFKAAQAAYCAATQNKFWQYHDLLFEHSSDLSENSLKRYASEIGIDSTRFNSCIGSEASRDAVMKDLQEARRAGIFSTPTFIINGRVLKGARNFEDFKAVIDQLLKEQKIQTSTK
jgi:protein-disulfide isomerase